MRSESNGCSCFRKCACRLKHFQANRPNRSSVRRESPHCTAAQLRCDRRCRSRNKSPAVHPLPSQCCQIGAQGEIRKCRAIVARRVHMNTKKEGRLRCHKRPKSREETPKEGGDSRVGLGVATAYPYLSSSRSAAQLNVRDHGPIRRFMALPSRPSTSAMGHERTSPCDLPMSALTSINRSHHGLPSRFSDEAMHSLQITYPSQSREEQRQRLKYTYQSLS
jgi:hypothetical protein